MSGQDLMIAMREQRILLIDTVNAMKTVGRKLAAAEYKYRIALRQEVLRLNQEDNVAWTACLNLAYGDEEVGILRYERDLKKSDYACCIEKINAIKTEVRLIEGEIKAEWGER